MSACSAPKATSDGCGNWTVQYQGCNGQMKSKTFPTQDQAQQNIQQHGGKGTIVPPGDKANKYTGGC